MSKPFDAGVALFDSPEFPQTSSGTAVSADGTRRFSTLSDLSSGTVWWTNTAYAEFRAQQLWRRANMRNDQLLRIPMGQLIHELGISFLPAAQQAEALFEVLREAILFCHDNYLSCVRPFQRLDWHMSEMLHVSRRLSAASPVLSAARDAHVYMSPAMQSGGGTQARETRTYCAPRTPRLFQMLDLPVPAIDTDWAFFEQREKVLGAQHLWELAGPAALVDISVSNVDESAGFVAPFGAALRASSSLRTWAPLPEAMFYADRADVVLKGFWRASKVSKVRDYLKTDPTNNVFSYSAGLVHEALLYSLMGLGTANQPPTGREPLAAYVAAYDRMQMVSLALRLYEAGYNPLSSACGGRLVISAAQPSFAELDKACEALGLESPMSGV